MRRNSRAAEAVDDDESLTVIERNTLMRGLMTQ